MGLFKPIWEREGLEGEKLGKALLKVREMTSQDQLREVSVRAHHGQVIEMAIGRIEDQALLTRIALGVEPVASDNARSLAARLLKDQEALIQVARTSPSESARIFATKQISDPRVVVDIARNATDPYERSSGLEAAKRRVKHCEDCELESFAMSDPDLCVTAVEQLGVPSLRLYRDPAREAMAMRIALASPFDAAWSTAMDILHPVALAKVARQDPDGIRGRAALERILDSKLNQSNQSDDEVVALLADVALRDSDDAPRAAALIPYGHVEQLADVAREASRLQARKAAIRKLSDDDVLMDLALGDADVCVCAAERLSDQGLLKEMLLERFDPKQIAADAALSGEQKKALFDAAVAALGNLDDLKAARLAAARIAEDGEKYSPGMAQHAQEQVERLKKTYRRLVCSVCGEPVVGRYSGRVQDMYFFTLGCGCPEVYAKGNWRVVIDEDGERDEVNPQNHHFKDWIGIWVCTNCHGLKSTSAAGKMPTNPRCRCEGAFPYKGFFEFEASADEDAVDVPTIQVSQEEARAKHEVVFGW